jgi:enoyl-CoA hydratase/carnithine racemase
VTMEETTIPSAPGGHPAVLYESADSVAIVTLNRPAALNAINAEMRAGIVAAVRRAEDAEDVNVIVVRGAGSRAFCAGADIAEFEIPVSTVAARRAKHAPQWIDVLADTPLATIAAIHGFCLGGGLEIALACDLRIAAAGASFALPEVGLAIIPGAGGTQRLSRAIGLGPALRLTLTGERIDAAEAYRLGVVSEVVADEQLAGRSYDLARTVAGHAPQAVAYAKEAIRRGYERPLQEGLHLECDLAAVLAATHDRVEAARAFREKRVPTFRGE